MRLYPIMIFLMTGTILLGQSEGQDYPEIIKIDALENIFYPVEFNHGKHARMEDMGEGCSVCHHYAEDDDYTGCAECHMDDPAEASLEEPTLNGAYHRSCLACHREWSNEQLCEACHQQKKFRFNIRRTLDKTDIFSVKHPHIGSPEIVTFPTPDENETQVTFHHKEHIELYRYDCVSCHRSENCASCHDYQGSVKMVVETQEEHHTSCQSCHDTETDGTCSFCHQDEVSKGFSHDLTGWPLKAYHGDNTCSDCHADQKPIEALANNCIACHDNFEVGSFEHETTGFQLSEDHLEIDCYECHFDESYSEPPECLECHDEEYLYPDFLPGIVLQKK
ncbi:MAG: cytochrome c3 family protein [Candidatus Marinimicrobia bacterium]|nr:cytochrome c3 family protein [Candidatus Neomarinimicrobiota bacterium]